MCLIHKCHKGFPVETQILGYIIDFYGSFYFGKTKKKTVRDLFSYRQKLNTIYDVITHSPSNRKPRIFIGKKMPRRFCKCKAFWKPQLRIAIVYHDIYMLTAFYSEHWIIAIYGNFHQFNLTWMISYSTAMMLSRRRTERQKINMNDGNENVASEKES